MSSLVKSDEATRWWNTQWPLTHSSDLNRGGLAVDATRSESWRSVPEYEGRYEVSDHGRVRSLDRVEVRSNGHPHTVRGRILRPGAHRLSGGSTSGKLVVALCENGKQKTHLVHRLVARAFLGEGMAGTEVCHRDDVGSNNHVSNLYWGTRSQNLYDAVRNHRHPAALKTHCKHGHEFTHANTAYHTNGGRQCRACRVVASRNRRRKSAVMNAEIDSAPTETEVK